MNDDQLAEELQRRADSAASRPDWVRRDLLPAVRHEIDARPQRVMTSNWSPRLGVAAVVAALLILVIAVPRLTPQPPAATPSPTASPAPGPDTVLSAADFAAGVSSGALDGRVVLVEGKVSVPATPPPFSFPCEPPNGVCGLGVLEGTDPPVYVDTSYEPTTDTPGSGTWAGGDGGREYHFPSVPIEGVLALQVMPHNHAFFIGTAGQVGAPPVRSVAEAQAIDISTVTMDQVVLVDGWLGGFTATRCLAHPVPTIALLPGRECSDELVSRDPYPEPGSPVIKVQPGAYAQFAPNPKVQDGNEPRKGLYALAPSLEGWCGDAQPPCWLWSVVARVNGPPIEPSVLAPATIECTRGTGLPITVIDEAGVVADCRTLDNVSASDQPHVFNPDGNLSRLWVWFTAGRCIRSVDAQLSVAPSGYYLVITDGATVPGCAGPPIGLGLELNLRTDIAGSTVHATLGTPQPTPSPSPTPTELRVLSADDFAAALAEGSLDGTTVLVDASIEPVDWKSGPICALPPATCVLGQLVSDAQPPIIVSAHRFQVREEDDHATYSGDGVTWAWWAGPDAPVDGTLVLSVIQDYQKVIFLGVAREGPGGDVWSVADASGLDANSFGSDEVVLVDGWLTGIGVPLRCSPPGHQSLDGLPSNDWCSNGAWLMSDTTQLDPSSFSIPPDSIRVQSGAFDEFAPLPGLRDGREVVPQHGIYAIAKRLFGGGRSEEPPFWAWAIVGRIGS